MCVQNWEPSWATMYDVICPRVLWPLLLSWRKVDWLGSSGSGYGLQNGLLAQLCLNSIIISAWATSIGPRCLTSPLSSIPVYAQISGLMSKLKLVRCEQSAWMDELIKSREGVNGLMAVICIVIAKSLIVRGLSIIKNPQMVHMLLFQFCKRQLA